jgi:hypothetical protein
MTKSPNAYGAGQALTGKTEIGREVRKIYRKAYPEEAAARGIPDAKCM